MPVMDKKKNSIIVQVAGIIHRGLKASIPDVALRTIKALVVAVEQSCDAELAGNINKFSL